MIEFVHMVPVKALIDTKDPEYCAVALCVDKEEVGSQGNTGMHSKFFENTVAELIELEGNYSELKVRRAMANSKVLSAVFQQDMSKLF